MDDLEKELDSLLDFHVAPSIASPTAATAASTALDDLDLALASLDTPSPPSAISAPAADSGGALGELDNLLNSLDTGFAPPASASGSTSAPPADGGGDFGGVDLFAGLGVEFDAGSTFGDSGPGGGSIPGVDVVEPANPMPGSSYSYGAPTAARGSGVGARAAYPSSDVTVLEPQNPSKGMYHSSSPSGRGRYAGGMAPGGAGRGIGGAQPQRATMVGAPAPVRAPARAMGPDIPRIKIEPVMLETATTVHMLPQNNMEMEFANEVLNCRRNPRFYADLLRMVYLPGYSPDNVLRMDGYAMQTVEGAAACMQAIQFLEMTPPNEHDLVQNFGMCMAAKEAMNEHAPHGSLAYPNSIGKLAEFGKIDPPASDISGYGGDNAREMFCLSFLICDGDPSRKRRNIILDPRWKVMGTAAGHHNSEYGQMAVLNFATNFNEDLNALKARPLFRLIESKVKPEAQKIAQAFAMMKALDFSDPAQEDRAEKLRKAAVMVSQATEKMVAQVDRVS